MKCYRCSYCCYYLNVVISPKYADLEDIDFEILEPLDDLLITIDGTIPCPHLSWDEIENLAICKVRNKKWFKKTPCYRHNCEDEPGECRLGKHIINDKDYLLSLKKRLNGPYKTI